MWLFPKLVATLLCFFCWADLFAGYGASAFSFNTSSSSSRTELIMYSGPTGLWCERYRQKLIDDSRIFCFISAVFRNTPLMITWISFWITYGFMYLKNVGSAYWNSSRSSIKFLSTGSFIPSTMSSKKVLKVSSGGIFFLLISADIASRLWGSRLCTCSEIFWIAAILVAQVLDMKQVTIGNPKSSIIALCSFFYSSERGSEWGKTIVG